MADVKFEVTEVFRHAGALAERSAVVRPVSGIKDMTKDGAVEAAVGKAVEVWRRRCNVLREAGLPVFNTVRFQYARNCPPVAVRCGAGGPPTHRCNVLQVCPWCWARRVVKPTFDRVSAAMTALSTLGTGEDPYKLVLVTRNFRGKDDAERLTAIFDRVGSIMTRTGRALRAKRAAGWALLSVVHPGVEGSGQWAYGTRALALVPRDYAEPEGAVVAPPTKRGVAGLVARFARYPTGMMFGDPKMVVRLMAVRGGHRLFRSAGVFRGTDPRPEPGADPRFLDL